MLAGLQLSKRDHVLPEVAEFGSDIVNALGVKLLEELEIKPSDIIRVESQAAASDDHRRTDLVLHLRNKRRVGIEFKTFEM